MPKRKQPSTPTLSDDSFDTLSRVLDYTRSESPSAPEPVEFRLDDAALASDVSRPASVFLSIAADELKSESPLADAAPGASAGSPRKRRKSGSVVGKRSKRARAIVFTDFKKPADFDWDAWKAAKPWCRYLVVGRETCPDTGKPHWQGYACAKNSKSLAVMKAEVGDNAHIEPARGSAEQNRQYCTKDGDYKELGIIPKARERTDLQSIKHAIDSAPGGPSVDVAYQADFAMTCRYRNGIADYVMRQQIKRAKGKKRAVKAYVYWGATGTGKTRTAFEENPEAYMITGDNLKWWQGYEQETTVIIDEYANQLKITSLLNLLDIYPTTVEFKGGSAPAAWDRIILTTNLTPAELHDKAKDAHRQALARRIWEWREFRDDGTQVVTPGRAQRSELYRAQADENPMAAVESGSSAPQSGCPMSAAIDVDGEEGGFIFKPRLPRSDCLVGESVADYTESSLS